MKFVDEVTIYVEGGEGGNGCSSFRREKYVPRGGPDGGDGGDGGNVILVGDGQIGTLLDLRYNQHQRAGRGAHGKGKQMTGARGMDRLVRVPLGSIACERESGELLSEIVKDGERLVIAKGGSGGRGNMRFTSAKNRSPRRADPGEPGEQKRLRLELKLLADVGLVGYPNVGKSTLISVVSSAKPKIADYPFTTLVPNLGVARARSGRSFVIADIPGLIEGASEGAGLGMRFLRHVERCAVLLHLVEFNEERGGDPLKDFHALKKELGHFAPEMLEKPQLAALTKSDLNPDPEKVAEIETAFKKFGLPFHVISSVTKSGLDDLLDALDARIKRQEPVTPSVFD